MPAYRDISAEQRAQAAACVERHVSELSAILGGAGLRCRVVEGSAVAAEVYLADMNTLHTAVRVAIFVAASERRAMEQTLTRGGFTAADPIGDTTLLRLAARDGRRPIHVLFGSHGSNPPDGAERRHPGEPAAARERVMRLSAAWLDLAATFRRVRHESRPDLDATESFEVQLIERD